MPSPDDDRWRIAEERYQSILKDFGEFAAETREYRIRNEKALADVEKTLLTYWTATAAGLRQLSDWFTRTEDAAQEERQRERQRLARVFGILIAIGVLWAVLLAIIAGYLAGLGR